MSFIKNKFFVKSKLNFAENLLSNNNNTKAITFISENGIKENRTWKELNKNVDKLIAFFKLIKLKEKDRVAAYLPNLIETVESFIATTSVGAIWSSCSPDFGAKGVIERFSQIKPKVLYGGSVNPINIKDLNKINQIDGFLIGGASQNPNKFIDIIKKTFN